MENLSEFRKREKWHRIAQKGSEYSAKCFNGHKVYSTTKIRNKRKFQITERCRPIQISII